MAGSPPPVSNARISQQSQITAPLSHVLAYRPHGNSLTSFTSAAADMSRATGRQTCAAFELPSDFEAVRLVFGAQAATDIFTIDGALVASSSTYGPSNSVGGGIAPYDEAGTQTNHWLPVTFNSAGAAKTPYDGLPTNLTGDTTGGMQMLSLVTSAATTSGTVLTFSSTFVSSAQGGIQPFSGMAVTSYGGGIPAGTTIASINNTTITLSQAVTVLSGELIAFSFVPLTLTQSISAPAGPITLSVVRSDWIPVSAQHRNDQVPAVGMSVSGTNIPAGTIVTAITPQTITLSQAPTGNATTAQALTFTSTYTLPASTTPLQLDVPCSNTSKIAAGQVVSGTGVTSGTIVSYVEPGQYFRLSKPTTSGLASGTVLTFTNTCYVYGTSGFTSGNPVVALTSTNNLPLLLVRAACSATGSNTVATVSYSNAPLRLDSANPGIPNMVLTRATVATDGIRVPTAVGQNQANGNGMTPVLWIEYLSRTPGHTVAVASDSQGAGLTSGANGSLSFGRLAAAALSAKDRPVSFANLGMSGQWFQNFGLAMGQLLKDTPIGVMCIEAQTMNSLRDTPASYAARLLSLTQLAKEKGAVPILFSEGAWGMRRPNPFVVASDVNSSTTVPVISSVPWTLTGVLATGTGITAGTTATLSKGAYSITLSAPVTLAAGSVIYLNTNTVESSTTNSTAVTFSQPFPIYAGGLTYVTWPGSSGVITITASQGATSGVLSSTQSIPVGTVLTYSSGDPYYTQRADGHRRFRQMARSANLLTWDYYKFLEDPADPGYYAERYTTDGVHANDVGHTAAAAAFLPVLRRALAR